MPPVNTLSTLRRSACLALVALLTACGAAASSTLPPPAPAYPAHASPTVLVGADSVQVLPRGSTAFPVILSLIAGARSSVELEMYEFDRSDIEAALLDAHRRGVAVTAIVDPSVEVTRATAASLRAAGIDVLDYPRRKQMIDHVKLLVDPSQRPSDTAAAQLGAAGVAVRRYRSLGEKLHAKLGVADGRDVIFGSANWTGGGFQRNHEVDVEILGAPVIAQELTAMMEADWAASAP